MYNRPWHLWSFLTWFIKKISQYINLLYFENYGYNYTKWIFYGINCLQSFYFLTNVITNVSIFNTILTHICLFSYCLIKKIDSPDILYINIIIQILDLCIWYLINIGHIIYGRTKKSDVIKYFRCLSKCYISTHIANHV